MEQTEEQGGQRQIACFLLGGEKYAVDIMTIKEVIRPMKVKPLPDCPRFVEGVINLRGAIIPVIDLRKRFGIPAPEKGGKLERMIIAVVKGRIVALTVDHVLEIIWVDRKAISRAPVKTKGGSDFLEGVCKVDDDLATLLNLDLIVSTEERIELEQIRREIVGPEAQENGEPTGEGKSDKAPEATGERKDENTGERGKTA